MNSDIKALLQIWSFQFFLSMGTVLSVAIALTVGVLLTHWLYLCARNIASKPTPLSFPKAVLILSGFQALVAGVVLVPFCTIGLFYLLSDFVWKLPPPNLPPPSTIDVPPPDLGLTSWEEWISSMTALVIYLAVLSAIIGGTIFFFIRHYAKRIDPEKVSIGFIKRVLRRYFHESIFVGFLLVLIACPVILFFLYNIAWLAIFLFPPTTQYLSQIAFANAEHLYFRSVTVIGSWLILILFLPAFWLLFRGLRLRWRYIIENPTLTVIFRRSVRFFCLGLFGYIGCSIMHLLADSLFKGITQTAFR